MANRCDWDPVAFVRLLLWIFVAFTLGGLGQSWLKTTLFPGDSDPRAWIALVAGQVLFHTTAIVATFRFLHVQGRTWSDGFGVNTRVAGRAIGIGLLAGLAFLPAAYGLQWVFNSLLTAFGIDLAPQRAVEILMNTSGAGRIGFFVVAVISAPVVEEIVFRGVLYPFIRDLGWPKAALLGTAVLFGLIHANVSVMVPLTAFGILLGLLYEHTGSILASIAAHITFNLAPFVMLFLGVEFGAGKTGGV